MTSTKRTTARVLGIALLVAMPAVVAVVQVRRQDGKLTAPHGRVPGINKGLSEITPAPADRRDLNDLLSKQEAFLRAERAAEALEWGALPSEERERRRAALKFTMLGGSN